MDQCLIGNESQIWTHLASTSLVRLTVGWSVWNYYQFCHFLMCSFQVDCSWQFQQQNCWNYEISLSPMNLIQHQVSFVVLMMMTMVTMVLLMVIMLVLMVHWLLDTRWKCAVESRQIWHMCLSAIFPAFQECCVHLYHIVFVIQLRILRDFLSISMKFEMNTHKIDKFTK